jgi:integrase
MPATVTTHGRTPTDDAKQVNGKVPELDRTLTWLRDEEAPKPGGDGDSKGARDGYLTGGVTYAAYHHRFGVAAGKAGLAGMTEHNLRHLFASTLLRNLAPITDVSEWLGHRDINITYAVYSHLLPDS